METPSDLKNSKRSRIITPAEQAEIDEFVKTCREVDPTLTEAEARAMFEDEWDEETYG